MPISNDTKIRIAQDAMTAMQERYADGAKNFEWKEFQDGYIAGGEAEAERAQPAIEALEYLVNDVRRKPNDTRYATALNNATEALASYNSKPVK